MQSSYNASQYQYMKDNTVVMYEKKLTSTSIGYMDVWAIAPAVEPAANLSTTLISFLSPLINFFIYDTLGRGNELLLNNTKEVTSTHYKLDRKFPASLVSIMTDHIKLTFG